MLIALVFSILMLAGGVVLLVGFDNWKLAARNRDLETALAAFQQPAPRLPADQERGADDGPFDRASVLLVERGDDIEVDEFDDQAPEADDWTPDAPELAGQEQPQ